MQISHMGLYKMCISLIYSIKYPICFKLEKKPPYLEDMKYKECCYHSYRNLSCSLMEFFGGKGLLESLLAQGT